MSASLPRHFAVMIVTFIRIPVQAPASWHHTRASPRWPRLL